MIDGLASDPTAPRTTYAYEPPTAPCVAGQDAGKTTVRRPDGSTTTYCYDRLLRVTARYPPFGFIDTVEEADAFIDLVVSDGNDARLDTLSPLERELVTGRPGWRWGGADHEINTGAEFDVVGAALAANPAAVWGELRTDDRVTMMDADDAFFDEWVADIDTSAPLVADDASIDAVSYADRTAQIVWSSGDDPEVAPDVQGSGIDDAEYRWRESDGVWRDWRAETENGFGIVNVDAGDVFFVELRERDRAGNRGPIGQFTLVMPDEQPSGEEVRAFAVFAPILACLRYCRAAGAVAIGGTRATVRRFTRGGLRVTPHRSDVLLDAWRASRWPAGLSDKAGRAFARRELRSNLRQRTGLSGKGLEAHHIVALNHRVARRAQEILARCRVPPNDARNGVFLTRKQHNRTKTHAYYENVNRLVEAYAISCGNIGGGPFGQKHITEALQDIGELLKKGQFVG